MYRGICVLLQILVVHLVLDKCLCAPQDLVVPEPEPEPEPVASSTQATGSNGEQLNIADGDSVLKDIPGRSEPQERPAPIQTQRNASDGRSISSSISSSNVAPHPLQLLIDSLMQPQISPDLMGGFLPRIPLNILGENSTNSLLHRIGVHALGRTEHHMNQTAETPLPFVVLALTTTPPSIASLANASITFSKGIQSISPFTLPPPQLIIPNSSLAVASTESVELVTSTESIEKHIVASTESLEHSTATKTASISIVPVSRPKPLPASPKKHQGKKSIEKSSKRRNPTANDAVERRLSMIEKMEKKIDIAITTARSMPAKTSSNTPAPPTTTPITTITSEQNETMDSSKFESNILVSKADIIDAILATSPKRSGSLESHINSNATLNPVSTTPTSTTIEATTSAIDIVSTTPLSISTPSTTPIVETTSALHPVTITSVEKSSTIIPVRSDLILDVSQLFRRIVHAAVRETTAAAAASRGEHLGNIVSIRRRG